MKFTELKTKSAGEIKSLLAELKLKAYDLSVKMKLKQVKNTREYGQIRKDIARVMTYLKSQEK